MPKKKKIQPTAKGNVKYPFADIGQRLLLTRKALELEVADLCVDLDIKQNQWSQYETGKRRISLDVALAMCDKYDTTLEWIYRDKRRHLPADLLENLQRVRAS